METLKVSVQDGRTCEKILKIELTKDEVQKEFQEFYTAVAPKAKIPGFRPGKAPLQVLAMHYKDEARESVLKHLITESYRQAVRDKALQPLGLPEIEEVNFKDDFLSYQARIEIRPKIKLSRVTGLTAKKEKAEIKPSEVEEALKRVSGGTFGDCEDCGDEIELKRLEARPTATLCVSCKETQEHREHSHIDGHRPKSMGARLRLA